MQQTPMWFYLQTSIFFQSYEQIWNFMRGLELKVNTLREALVTREKEGRKTRKKWMASENLSIMKEK